MMANLKKLLNMLGLALAAALMLTANPVLANNVDVSSQPDYGYEYDRSEYGYVDFDYDSDDFGYHYNVYDYNYEYSDYNYERDWDFNLNEVDPLDGKPVDFEVEKDEEGIEVEKDGQDILETGLEIEEDGNMKIEKNGSEDVEVIETDLEVEKDGEEIIETGHDKKNGKMMDAELNPEDAEGILKADHHMTDHHMMDGKAVEKTDLEVEKDGEEIIEVNGDRDRRGHWGRRGRGDDHHRGRDWDRDDHHRGRGWDYDNNLFDPVSPPTGPAAGSGSPMEEDQSDMGAGRPGMGTGVHGTPNPGASGRTMGATMGDDSGLSGESKSLDKEVNQAPKAQMVDQFPGMIPDWNPVEVPGYPDFPEEPVEIE